MKIVCVWCKKDMGEKDGMGVEGISHSICEECYEKLVLTVKDNFCFHDDHEGLQYPSERYCSDGAPDQGHQASEAGNGISTGDE